MNSPYIFANMSYELMFYEKKILPINNRYVFAHAL